MLTTIAGGFVARSAETKTIGDKSYASFSIAHSQGKGDNKKTTWVSILASDKLAQFITKGQYITAIGSLSFNAYIDKEGNPQSSVTIWANQIEFCGQSRNAEPQSGSPAAGYEQLYGEPRDVRAQQDEAPASNDLPF